MQRFGIRVDKNVLDDYSKVLTEKINVLEKDITSDNNWCNRTIRQLDLPENLIIALVKRGEENIIPIGDTLIQNGDVVVIYRR